MWKLINHVLKFHLFAAIVKPLLHLQHFDYMVPRMTDNETNTSEPRGERIAKVLARVGIASRREVERMIEAGRIKLDGKVLETPAVLVTSLEGIQVDGDPIGEAEETRLWRYNKPRDVMSTNHDPEGRKTMYESLPEHMPRVISIGRLDMNTEGLMLLTNDGELARWLELPANNVIRKYRVRVHGRVTQKRLDSLANGVVIEGIQYGKVDAKLERPDEKQSSNSWITVAITEGKNREVRRLMAHLELEVSRLQRVAYGPFTVGTLQRHAVAEVPKKQMTIVLKEFYESRKGSIALTDDSTINPKKWAKAKPKRKKPGESRRRKIRREIAEGHSADREKSRGDNIETRRGSKALDAKEPKKRIPRARSKAANPTGKSLGNKDFTAKRPPKGRK